MACIRVAKSLSTTSTFDVMPTAMRARRSSTPQVLQRAILSEMRNGQLQQVFPKVARIASSGAPDGATGSDYFATRCGYDSGVATQTVDQVDVLVFGHRAESSASYVRIRADP